MLLVPPVGIIAVPPQAVAITASKTWLVNPLLLLINVLAVIVGRATGGTIPVGLGQIILPADNPVPGVALKIAPFWLM